MTPPPTPDAGSVTLAGRHIEYRIVRSRAARRVSLRIGPSGVDVIQPLRRRRVDVAPLFVEHERWVLRQLDRVARLRAAYPPVERAPHEILLHGTPTPVTHATTRALEAWLKRQACRDVERELATVTALLGVTPRRVFLRSQRTMWGSCSTRGNLSFNWRCVMAPPEVLRYLVVHEATHLLHPNHSRRYWETVRRLHPDVDGAKRWLTANGHHLMLDLERVVSTARQISTARALHTDGE